MFNWLLWFFLVFDVLVVCGGAVCVLIAKILNKRK